MDSAKRDCTWPVLCIMACLFILAAAAPRAWERVARHQSADTLIQHFTVAANTATEDGRVQQWLQGPDQLAPIPPAVLSPQDKGLSDLPRFHIVAETAGKVAGLMSGSSAASPWDSSLSDTSSGLIDNGPIVNDLASSTKVATSAGLSLPTLVATGPSIGGDRDAGAAVDVPLPTTDETQPEMATDSRPDVAADAVPQPAAPAIKPVWQTPPSLARRLERLWDQCEAGSWALDVGRELRKLGQALSLSDAAEARFDAMEGLLCQSEELAAQIADEELAAEMRRTSHAVGRRVELWKCAVAVGGAELLPVQPPQADPQQLALCLARLDAVHTDTESAETWNEYLMVDDLRQAARSSGVKGDQRLLRRLAQRVLQRLSHSAMNAEQRAFAASQPMRELSHELRSWAAEPVDLKLLLESVERFEQTGLPSDAVGIADAYRHLCLSTQPQVHELAQQLEDDYRNANLRVAISKDLLNRLIPDQPAQYEYVRETILGVPVRGRSLANSDLSIHFLPDPDRLRMVFQVEGQISSATSSNAGPATFFNDSDARFRAEKEIEINDHGIHLADTRVQVYNNTRLRALRTAFDGIPLIGMLAQSAARSQHEQQRPQATWEAEAKISAKTRQRIDAEAYAKLSEAVERLRERVYHPLQALDLRPTILSGQTTEERMTMRLRLAAGDQLAASTPRPRAPEDSVFSVQIHETAMNNLVEQLELDGRKMSLPELSQHVSDKLGLKRTLACDPSHEDVCITFADRNAVSVHCQDGQVVLHLAVAEVSKAPRVWKDFQVRVFYRAQANGRSAELVRDGVIHLLGRMSTGNQIAVRGIFAKAFPQNTPVRLTPQRLVDDEKLSDLTISQFVVEDGWIGVAMGPQTDRVAVRRVETK